MADNPTYPSRAPLSNVERRAARDAEFRSRLLTAPEAALRECGVVPPDGVNVCVLEESADNVTVVLAAVPDAVSGLNPLWPRLDPKVAVAARARLRSGQAALKQSADRVYGTPQDPA